MIDSIGAVPSVNGVGGVSETFRKSGVGQASSGSFSDVMEKMLDTLNESSQKASDLSKRLQMDDPTASVEQTVIAMNTSSLQFTAVVQARNKVMQAYSDIMNMPV